MLGLIYFGTYFYLFSYRYKEKPLILWCQKEIWTKPSLFKYSYEGFQQTKTLDILFVGSSHTYRYFDPSIFESFGLNVYNLGSSSQTMELTDALVRNVTVPPRVVLEFYPVLFTIKGEESFWDWNISINDYSTLCRAALNLQSLRCFNLITLKPFLNDLNENFAVSGLDSTGFNKGYVSRRDSAGLLPVYESYSVSKDSVESRLLQMRSTLSYLKSSGINICYVYGPVPEFLNIKNEKWLILRFEQFCREMEVPFYNFSRNFPFHPAFDFFDDDHINQSGVTKFNLSLIKKMQEDGFLKLKP